MKEKTKTVYFADDGKLFEHKAECEEYEAEIRKVEAKTTYWLVICNPDLTEGRGWYHRLYIRCVGPTNDPALWMTDWCFRQMGSPLTFVQGSAPTQKWMLRPTTRKEFLSPQDARVGDHSYPAKVYNLTIDHSGKFLEEF